MSHFEGTHIVRDDMNTNDKRYLLSDLHWDNPHCERDFLIRTLEKAKRENAKVYINGDFFCFMQGRGDPRRSKSEIRPEHNKGNYIDAVINDAVEFFTPYAHLIKFIGYGNHESSLRRILETDVLERFITLLNYKAKSTIERGGYGGWVAIRLGNEKDISTGKYRNFNIKYHHGWGGGGAVTHGIIQHNRMQVVTQNADAIWLGHTHSMYILPTASEKYNSNSGKVEKGTIWNLRTPSFKEEHDNRQLGFQAQSNNGNKCIGYIELTLTGTRATGYYPEFVPIIYKMY